VENDRANISLNEEAREKEKSLRASREIYALDFIGEEKTHQRRQRHKGRSTYMIKKGGAASKKKKL